MSHRADEIVEDFGPDPSTGSVAATPMRMWTLQAPEVAAVLSKDGCYRAEWGRVPPNCRRAYLAMAEQMRAGGINCGEAPPVWCWPGRALRRSRTRMTANLLLGLDQWAHGVVLLRLDVPSRLAVTTSYSRWNDYLRDVVELEVGREVEVGDGRSGPADASAVATMDWEAELVGELDQAQITIPEVRREWVTRIRRYPPDAETAQLIAEKIAR